jgi:hypothetical protein
MIKSGRLRWAGHVAYAGFVQRLLGKHRNRSSASGFGPYDPFCPPVRYVSLSNEASGVQWILFPLVYNALTV